MRSEPVLIAQFPMIKREDAQRFLQALDNQTDQFTFQLFDDDRHRKDKSLTGVLHGTLDKHCATMVEYSRRGAGVYVTVNETDLRGRKAGNIVRVRAYFVDLDGAPLANLGRLNLRPHMIVPTSPGKFHVYWLMKDAPLDQFKETQKRLLRLIGGDPNVCDLPHVMRLPGFPHQKETDRPFLVNLFACEFTPHSQARFIEALAAAEAKSVLRMGAVGTDALGGLPSPPDMTQGYPDGYRTRELTKRAGWCLGPARMTEAQTLQGCLAWNQHNVPPLPDDKVRHTVANIVKAEARKRAAANSGKILRTDLGNARLLVKRHGINVRFIYEWRKWIVWSGNRWEVDNDGAVDRLAKETVTAMHLDALQAMDQTRISHALRSQSEARLKAMVSLAETEQGIVLSAAELDSNPWLLGVQNGVIVLKEGKFRAGRREDFITKQAGVAYDPDAKCHEWLKFLDTITGGNLSQRSYIQRLVGYALTGLVREEVMFVLYGIGNNGKSTFRETLHALLGDYALSSDASLMTERKTPGGATEEIARLKGRRFVAVNETNENDQLHEARIKFTTSQDTITARNLYGHFFDFFPTHKTFVTTNHKPIVRGTDEGIWRRLHLIPFTVTIPKSAVEKDFRERRLMPELAGILNWAIAGVAAYLKEGLNPPAIVRTATDDYRQDMDVVGQWLEERCVRDPNAGTPTGNAYEDYAYWAGAEIGWALTRLRWRRNLSDRGFEAAKGTHGQRVIKGLRLKYAAGLSITVIPGGRSSPPAG
jgi:putative DNA primase/helicase